VLVVISRAAALSEPACLCSRPAASNNDDRLYILNTPDKQFTRLINLLPMVIFLLFFVLYEISVRESLKKRSATVKTCVLCPIERINCKIHIYEIRPRKDGRGFDLISDRLPFRRLWYVEPNAVSNAVGYAKFYSRSHDAVIRVYDEAGNMIETHEHAGDFKEW
jgi:hypothetical protein